jgi:hypothetical protein
MEMRQIKHLIKSDKAIYSGLFLIAFAVVFSSTFNPLNFREMHVDTSVYITISKGIINGLLPYKDLVDNKGPLMYLMSVPGLFFGGFTGVWITELILMCISVLFAYKTALFFADKYKAFLGTALCFIILLAFFTVNAGTEEYSLPFLMISFYLFIKYYFSEKREIRFYESIILGICFAWVTMIRLNMFSLWAVFCLMIFIESVIKRRFALLGKYILGFLLGIIAVFTPVFFYLKLNGILNEFILQVIFAGSLRGFSGANIKETIKSFYYVINLTYSFVPLFIGLYWIIAEFKQKNLFFYLGYILTYILFILFFSISPGGKHYNMVLIPFFIPAIISLIDILYSLFSDEKIKKIIILFLLFLAFTNEGFGKYFWTLSRMFIGSTGLYLFSTGKIIDENTKMDDKIISLGFNGYIYPFTRRGSVSKYFYQGSGLNQIPGAKEEFLSDVLTNKPAMIVIYTGPYMNEEYMDDWHAPIYKMMDNEYYLFSKNVLFKLYKRNN